MSPPITPEQLAALPPEFQAILQAVIEHYGRRIAELEAEIQRLKKTPRNSSLPPSSEHPHAKPPAAGPKSKRRRGGHHAAAVVRAAGEALRIPGRQPQLRLHGVDPGQDCGGVTDGQ